MRDVPVPADDLPDALVPDSDLPDATTTPVSALDARIRKGEAKFVPSGEKDVPSLTDPDMIAANPATRVALGAASPFIGAAQIGGHISDAIYKAVGIPFRPGEALDDYIKRVDDLVASGREKTGSKGIDWANVLGTILSPAALAALKIPVAASRTGKVAQGVAVGTAGGVTAPVVRQEGESENDFLQRKAEQVALGAAFGAGVPATVMPAKKLFGMLYHGVIEPWMAPAAIKGRAFLEAAGDKADEIINLLRTPNEIVPGSVPTAGQAATPAGRAEFAALQRSAEKVLPSDYVARTDAQNAARLAQVRAVGKDAKALADAETARAQTTGELYKEAYETMVKRDPELRALWKNPYFKESVGDAFKLLKANEQLPLSKNLTQFLHYVKEGLDAKIQAANKPNAPAISRGELRAMQDVKKRLVDWMAYKNPKYEEARETFAEMSAPINQMKIGQYLEDKLVPAVSDEAKQSATQYSSALRDAPGTIRKSAGGPRFEELSKVLEPEQLRAVESVRDDLARNVRFEELAKAGAKAGPTALDLATANLEKQLGGRIPNILHRGAMIVNAIIERVEGKINQKLAAEMAIEMLNPAQVGESLAKAKARAAFNAKQAEMLHQAFNWATAYTTHEKAKRQQKERK